MFLGVGLATIIYPILYNVSKRNFIKFKFIIAPIIGLIVALIFYWTLGIMGIANDKLWLVQLAPVASMPVVFIGVKIGIFRGVK